jgi:hypothetical protein
MSRSSIDPSTPDVAGSWQVMVGGSAPLSSESRAPTNPQNLSGGASSPAAFTAAPQAGGTKSAYDEMLGVESSLSSDDSDGGAPVEVTVGSTSRPYHNPHSFSAKRPPVQKKDKKVRFVLPTDPRIRIPERGVTTSRPVRSVRPSVVNTVIPNSPPPSARVQFASAAPRSVVGPIGGSAEAGRVFGILCGKFPEADHGGSDTGRASEFELLIRRHLNEGCLTCGLPAIAADDQMGHRGTRVAARHFFRCTQPTDRERYISNYEARVRCMLHCRANTAPRPARNLAGPGRVGSHAD